MPNYRKNIFSAGEITPLMLGAVDSPIYQQGVRTMKNMIPNPTGGAIRRPGFELVHEMEKEWTTGIGGAAPEIEGANLFTIQVTRTESIQIVITDEYIRILKNGRIARKGIRQEGGYYQFPSPYAAADVDNIQMVEVKEYDSLYDQECRAVFVCKGYNMFTFYMSDDADWPKYSFRAWYPRAHFPSAGEALITPSNTSTPTFGLKDDSTLLTPGSGDIDITNWLVAECQTAGTAAGDSTAMYAMQIDALGASGSFNVFTYSGSGVLQAHEYADWFAETNGPTDGTVFTFGFLPVDPSAFKPIAATMYENRFVCIYEDANKEFHLLGSSVNSIFDFRLEAQLDAAYDHVLRDFFGSEIYWLNGVEQKLLMGGAGGVYALLADNENGAIGLNAFSNPMPVRQSAFGACQVNPTFAGDLFVFINSAQDQVLGFQYDDARKKFFSLNLSRYAEHLFQDKRAIGLAFQKDPIPILWVLLDDGELLSCVYDPEVKMLAWAQHEHAIGDIKAITTGADEKGRSSLWAAVHYAKGPNLYTGYSGLRQKQWLLERMHNFRTSKGDAEGGKYLDSSRFNNFGSAFTLAASPDVDNGVLTLNSTAEIDGPCFLQITAAEGAGASYVIGKTFAAYWNGDLDSMKAYEVRERYPDELPDNWILRPEPLQPDPSTFIENSFMYGYHAAPLINLVASYGTIDSYFGDDGTALTFGKFEIKDDEFFGFSMAELEGDALSTYYFIRPGLSSNHYSVGLWMKTEGSVNQVIRHRIAGLDTDYTYGMSLDIDSDGLTLYHRLNALASVGGTQNQLMTNPLWDESNPDVWQFAWFAVDGSTGVVRYFGNGTWDASAEAIEPGNAAGMIDWTTPGKIFPWTDYSTEGTPADPAESDTLELAFFSLNNDTFQGPDSDLALRAMTDYRLPTPLYRFDLAGVGGDQFMYQVAMDETGWGYKMGSAGSIASMSEYTVTNGEYSPDLYNDPTRGYVAQFASSGVDEFHETLLFDLAAAGSPDIENLFDAGDSWTIAFHVNKTGLGDAGTRGLIFGRVGMFNDGSADDGAMIIYNWNGGYADTVELQFFDGSGANTMEVTNLSADEWNHIGITGSGDTIQIYLNGELATEGTYVDPAISWGSTGAGFQFGGTGSGTDGFYGMISDFRLYAKQFSLLEMRTLADEISPVTPLLPSKLPVYNVVVQKAQGELANRLFTRNTEAVYGFYAGSDGSLALPADEDLFVYVPFDFSVQPMFLGGNTSIEATGLSFEQGNAGGAALFDKDTRHNVEVNGTFNNGEFTIMAYVKAYAFGTDASTGQESQHPVMTTWTTDRNTAGFALECFASYDGADVSRGVRFSAVGTGSAPENDSIDVGGFSLGTWHHVAAVFKGGEYIGVYLDGEGTFLNDPNFYADVGDPTAIIWFGEYGTGTVNLGDNGVFGWNGLMTEARMYNRVLSADEISGFVRYPDGPKKGRFRLSGGALGAGLGTPYETYTRLFPIATYELEQSINKVLVNVFKSAGGKVGDSLDNADPLSYDDMKVLQDASGDYTGIIEIPGVADFDKPGDVYIIQDRPLPLNLMSVTVDFIPGE
jgi:hypothetical protein